MPGPSGVCLSCPEMAILLIEAEAVTRPGGVEVAVRQTTVAPSDLPLSVLHYVIRTQEGVLLDDASTDKAYAEDEYVRLEHSRSILCLPIVKQARLVGALYLENNLTPGVFTPDRVTVLQLLASQAAISLENASLYSAAKEAEQKIRQGESELRQILDIAPQHVYVLQADPGATRLYANQAALDYFGLTFEEWRTCDLRKLFHPDDWERANSGTQTQVAGRPPARELKFVYGTRTGNIGGFFPVGIRSGMNSDASPAGTPPPRISRTERRRSKGSRKRM